MPRWPFRLMAAGAALALLSGAAIFLLAPVENAEPAPASIIRLPSVFPTPTPASDALIQRQPVVAAADAVTPVPDPATLPPAVSQPTTASPVVPPVAPPVIEWSDADKNILSWVCYAEVGGMDEVKIDACLSVISTIRARYAPDSPFHQADIVSVLQSPGQFPGVHWEAERPGPDPELMWTVNQYRAGMRGSCTGYLYFDSVPGGPSLCVIRSSNNQFMEFHSGWN